MEKQHLDMHGLLWIIRRRRNWIYFSFCIAMLIATFLNSMPPTYEAKVTIQVKPSSKGFVDNSGTAWSSVDLARQKMYTYAELIKSQTVVEAALNKLSADEHATLRYENVINQITVRPLKDTEILNMFVTAKTPQEAQNLANALALAFNERLLDVVRAESKETRIFIGERLTESKHDLDNAEKALLDYKRDNKVVSISEQARALVERQSILRKLEADNQLALDAAKAKKQTPSVIVDTPVLQQYRIRLAEQEAELVGLLKNFTEQHPRVLSLKASIAENQTKLKNELERIANGEVALSETQRAALQKIISQDKQELAKLPITETGLARLMLDYSVAESKYTILTKRYEEARIGEIMEPTNMHIFDMASLPEEQVKPKKTFNLCIAAFLGVFIGTILTFIVEYFYKTIDTAEELQQYLSVPVLGIVPRVYANSRWQGLKRKFMGKFETKKAGKHRKKEQSSQSGFYGEKEARYVIKDREQSSLAEAFRALCANIREIETPGKMQIVLFTGASSGDGETMAAVNSAALLAHAGKRVVLLDCDFRCSIMADIFSIKNIGLTNLIQDEVTEKEILQDSWITNLKIVTSGSSSVGPVTALSDCKTRILLDYLRTCADYIFITSSPILIKTDSVVSDACILASKVDGVVLVIESQTVKPQKAKKVLQLLLGAKANVIGTVLDGMKDY